MSNPPKLQTDQWKGHPQPLVQTPFFEPARLPIAMYAQKDGCAFRHFAAQHLMLWAGRGGGKSTAKHPTHGNFVTRSPPPRSPWPGPLGAVGVPATRIEVEDGVKLSRSENPDILRCGRPPPPLSLTLSRTPASVRIRRDQP